MNPYRIPAERPEQKDIRHCLDVDGRCCCWYNGINDHCAHYYSGPNDPRRKKDLEGIK